MDSKAEELINQLKLEPHPEGGYFREIFRSPHLVHPPDGREARRALTSIFFLLPQGEYSCWHKVRSDEIWHFYEGANLKLYSLARGSATYKLYQLGPVSESCQPVASIPAGCWQCAQTTGNYTLVGCTVGPGFEFEDFHLLRDNHEQKTQLKIHLPEMMKFL